MKTDPKKPDPKKAEQKSEKASKKKKFCAADDCKSGAVSHGYCRLHYIQNYRNLKTDKMAKAERRLNAYVDRIQKKYPKDYLERIKEGLQDEGKFKETMEELEIDADAEAPETEREYLEKFIRTIKGE